VLVAEDNLIHIVKIQNISVRQKSTAFPSIKGLVKKTEYCSLNYLFITLVSTPITPLIKVADVSTLTTGLIVDLRLVGVFR